jgi:transcriptional regulator with XRE-family HTH domain
MKKTLYSNAGEILRLYFIELRKKAGLTQRELAKKLRRPYNVVIRIEQGQRRVDLAEFFLICKTLELNPLKEAPKVMKLLSKATKS